MRINDLLDSRAIDLNAQVSTKEEAINRLVALMAESGKIEDVQVYQACVEKREEAGSTGIGEGVAIPHAKTNAVREPGLAAMVVKNGCDYDSLDGQPTRLFFLIAAPDTEENVHLDVLGRLSVLLMDDDFRKGLMEAESVEEFRTLIDQADAAVQAQEEQPAAQAPQTGYRLLAVTACPTGIAHTYMAAQGLMDKAEELGVAIKVETDGSGGVKNELTKAEIAACEGVIIAADREVEMARFDGKRVLRTKVADGINKPQQLIEAVLAGKAPVYHAGEKNVQEDSESAEKEGVGRKVYKYLMNGVSHMLPFVIGGGILIALAFLFDTLLAPDGPGASFGSNSAVAAFLKKAGDVAFGFMLPVLAGFIAMAIADRPGLMVGFVGGALANLGVCFQNGTFVDVNTADANVVSSGFLGALVAGFLGGFIVKGIEKLCDKLPHSLEGIKPVLIYPFFGLLFTSIVMIFAVDPLFSKLNVVISNALNSLNSGTNLAVGILLGALVGGMMSVDMGGPVNKAAYLFGTASLVVGGQAVSSSVMASVMVGGMVPPLAIALCSTFFKNRFTKKERDSGLTNYVMGLCFITEGVIPFAASDPLRVIPSCIVGSAVSGALSMAFGCKLPAPHGGLFVFPVVERWYFYLLALIIGSVVSMFLLALFKKPLPAEKSGLAQKQAKRVKSKQSA